MIPHWNDLQQRLLESYKYCQTVPNFQIQWEERNLTFLLKTAAASPNL